MKIAEESIIIFFQGSLRSKSLKRTAFIWKRNVKVFTDSFNEFNTSLLNKSMNFFIRFLLKPQTYQLSVRLLIPWSL